MMEKNICEMFSAHLLKINVHFVNLKNFSQFKANAIYRIILKTQIELKKIR
jgi:hypothetical protein